MMVGYCDSLSNPTMGDIILVEKSATMRTVTPWKLANAKSQGSPRPATAPPRVCCEMCISSTKQVTSHDWILLLLTGDCAEVSLPGHSGPNVPRKALP